MKSSEATQLDWGPHLGVLAQPPDHAGEPGGEGGHHDVVDHQGVLAEDSPGCGESVSLVSILSDRPPGGERENHREVAAEYSGQQPSQSSGCPHVLQAVPACVGSQWPHWVRYEESGGVAGHQVGEELHPSVGTAQDHSPPQHVV